MLVKTVLNRLVRFKSLIIGNTFFTKVNGEEVVVAEFFPRNRSRPVRQEWIEGKSTETGPVNFLHGSKTRLLTRLVIAPFTLIRAYGSLPRRPRATEVADHSTGFPRLTLRVQKCGAIATYLSARRVREAKFITPLKHPDVG